MAGSNEFLSDWKTLHSLAFGAGAAVAIGLVWLVGPGGALTTLEGSFGLLLVGASFALVLASERLRETVRREPPYFVAGLTMGAVLGVKLFS